MSHLNISQRDLARLLNVSSSGISMFSIDKRDLPTSAWEKYRDLQVNLHEVLKNPPTQHVVPDEAVQMRATLKARLKRLNELLKKEQKLFGDNTKRYEKSAKALALLHALKPKGKGLKLADTHWWDDRILAEKSTMRYCNKQTLMNHRLKIGVIEGEILVVNALLKEL